MMLVRLWLLLVLSCNLTLQTNANMEGCLFGDSLQTVDKAPSCEGAFLVS
jgi:hypothetical protein